MAVRYLSAQTSRLIVLIPESIIDTTLNKHSQESKYLNFCILDKKPKTYVIGIETKYSDALGALKWYGPWRQYVFTSKPDCIFNVGCMNDIIKLTDTVNKLQKVKRK